MDTEIADRLQKAIRDKVFPGCVLGIVYKDGRREFFPAGHFTYDADSVLVTKDTIYDLASVTKSIPGSCSLLKLIDEGQLGLEDRLVDYLPEFGNFENKKEVRIKHILTYTLDLDLPSMATFKDKTADEIMEIVTTAPLKNPPGSKYLYTNSTATFVGLIVEKVTGMSIDRFADKYFFRPLHMRRTTFFPEHFLKEEIAPTEIDPWRGRTIQGEVHDESTFILRKKYITTAAGLFSTTPDILTFLEMLLHRGVYEGARYFSEEMIQQMYTNQLATGQEKAGLGWAVEWKAAPGIISNNQTFYKTGFTGTFVLVDAFRGIAFTLLSNRTYPKRSPDTSAINEVRKDVTNIILSI